MGTAHKVIDCPRDGKEWQHASHRLNCSDDASSPMNRYHCLPADNLTTLLEFCYNRTRTQVVKGTHTVKSAKKHMQFLKFILFYSKPKCYLLKNTMKDKCFVLNS